MPKIFGHRSCKSLKEVPSKEAYDKHGHGQITNAGKIAGVTKPMLLVTDAEGYIVAATEFTGDLTINGTLTAAKVVGAVYI